MKFALTKTGVLLHWLRKRYRTRCGCHVAAVVESDDHFGSQEALGWFGPEQFGYYAVRGGICKRCAEEPPPHDP